MTALPALNRSQKEKIEMPEKNPEVERRKELALAAIKAAYGTEEDEFGATLFVSHHLEEIEKDCWKRILGTETPSAQEVLNILVLQSHWGDEEDGNDTFDFTLPEEVTNYVISVAFDEEGNVDEVTMES